MNNQMFIYLDSRELSRVRDALVEGNVLLRTALEHLTGEADRLLDLAPTAVTDKTSVAASGDPHDFFAIGGYSWPNPSTNDGLPYLYRDSETNPEALNSDAYDKGRYEEMTARVATLALAYFFTSEPRYSRHAASLLRVWFIDASTRMNPNFRYAAARPGVWDGHFSGTIEGVYLIEMLDYVALLEASPEWTAADDASLRAWFRELSAWLAHSPFGRREIYSTNNHSSYLLAQIAAFSTYGGDISRARRALKVARSEVSRQIRRDGSMPREIDRADGWFYSVYGLRAFIVLARLAEKHDMDLWRTNHGVIAQACASLVPYVTAQAPWPFTRARKPWRHDAVQLFHVASRAYSSPLLRQAAMDLLRTSDEPIPHGDLLGVEFAEVGSTESALPAPRAWTKAGLHRPTLALGIHQTLPRILGVLAARGIWPGRQLP